MAGERAFEFGKNWQAFVNQYLTEERLAEAKRSLVAFCGEEAMQGKSFLDIGCGSGLFSLAAHQLGARSVFSFDVDPQSVECCHYLHAREGSPENWQVREGSILDRDFFGGIPAHEFVYSWGVLHHTGRMWEAIDNAASLVAPEGQFYLAIYNKADGLAIYPDGRMGPSGFWEKEKRFYARLPLAVQNVIDYGVMAVMVVAYLATFKNPARKIREHARLRGMSWRIDIKDWLGGYPYEYASADEIFVFLKQRGFSLENLKCNNGLLNNEFLFRRLPGPEDG